MANLLYVNDELLAKLRRHRSYLFWHPIIQNSPIRNAALEERAFHPRNIEVANGSIYLTNDMKFVYCRDSMVSYLYSDQDLSFRFTVSSGILRTLDNKQFSCIIGEVARITASNDAELVNENQCYHPIIDAMLSQSGSISDFASAQDSAYTPDGDQNADDSGGKSKKKGGKTKGSSRRSPAGTSGGKPAKPASPAKTPRSPAALRKEIIRLRTDEKKSFPYLAAKFKMDQGTVKAICESSSENQTAPVAKSTAAVPASDDDAAVAAIVAKLAPDIRAKIFHMKNVSKKSYQYVAEKYVIPVKAVRLICSQDAP